MNPTTFTITLPVAVTEWAAANNIDLPVYVRDVLSLHLEMVLLQAPPASIQQAVSAVRLAVHPTVS